MICILPLITTFKNCYAIKFKHWHKHINKQLTGIRRKCLKNKSSFLMLLWIVYFVDIWMRVHACRGGHSQLVDLDIIPREWPLLCGVLWAYSSHICVHIFVTCFWVCKCEWNLLLIYLYLFFFFGECLVGWLLDYMLIMIWFSMVTGCKFCHRPVFLELREQVWDQLRVFRIFRHLSLCCLVHSS